MTSEAKLQGEANLRGSAAALRKTAEGRRDSLSRHIIYITDADVASACTDVTDYGCWGNQLAGSCADTCAQTE